MVTIRISLDVHDGNHDLRGVGLVVPSGLVSDVKLRSEPLGRTRQPW
jgi:hypothetical protein